MLQALPVFNLTILSPSQRVIHLYMMRVLVSAS